MKACKKAAHILVAAALTVCLLMPGAALAAGGGQDGLLEALGILNIFGNGSASNAPEGGYYTVYGPNGSILCRIGGAVYVDDEYISGDNQLYRITSTDTAAMTAQAEHLGEEPALAQEAFQSQAQTLRASDGKKLIGIYCTHSDESYEPTDGISASESRGGIYDVANKFAEELNALGIETIVDETMHHPHDAGAYRRSQSTAAALAKKGPNALIDVHRDGVPADEYAGSVEGENMTMIRLLVGKRNPNSAANRDFAKQIKAKADAMYPGLIKDIFIGKGNYNQELMPHSILLEFGTYLSDKNLVLKSVPYIAEVISTTLYGDAGQTQASPSPSANAVAPGATARPGATGVQPGATAQVERQSGENEGVARSSRGAGSGIAWVIGIFVAGLVVVGLIVGGTKGFGGRIGRTFSEMTGGLFGKKPPRD